MNYEKDGKVIIFITTILALYTKYSEFLEIDLNNEEI